MICYTLYLIVINIYTNMEPEGPYSESIETNTQFGLKRIAQWSSKYERSNPLELNSRRFDHSNQQNLIRTSYPLINEKDHHQHFDDLLNIRVSPGFRLLDVEASHATSNMLHNDFDQLKSKASQLQATFQSYITQTISKSLQKVECYKDFLSSNAISKIYSRLQYGVNGHQYCCKRVFDRLEQLDLKGQANEKSVEVLIHQEIQLEKLLLKYQIDFFNTETMKIFQQVKEENHFFNYTPKFSTESQPIAWSSAVIDDENGYLKEQQQFEQVPFVQNTDNKVKIEQQVFELCKNTDDNGKIKNLQQLDHTYREIRAYEDSRLLASFISPGNDQRGNGQGLEEKESLNKVFCQLKESSIQNEANWLSTDRFASKKWPKGVEFVEPDILIVRNIISTRYKEFFKDLSSVDHIKHIIIEKQDLATVHYIKQMIAQSKAIEGIHIHCSFKFNPKLLEISKLKYMSFMPNYRFIRIIDKFTYFSYVKKSTMPTKVLSNIEQVAERPFFRNMYICQNIHPPISETVEQLHFTRLKNDSKWSIRYETLFQIETPNKLLVLTFKNIIFKYPSACFKTIFCKYKELHTIAFQNCQGYQNKGVKQLRYLRCDQLKNLQISGDGLEKKIILKPDAVEEIFRHYTLETLILTNIQFVDMMKRPVENSSVLKSIYRLNFLTHLNLYSSEPICDDFLKYISKSSVKNMEMLNLGFSRLTSNSVIDLSYFQRLESLCLDYTCFGDAQFLQITKRMTKLKQLSIQSLNGGRNDRYGRSYGLITPYFFENLTSKDIWYLNIYNCQALKECRWNKFNNIECIRINKGLLSNETISFMRRKGTNFLIEQGDAEITAVDVSELMINNGNVSQQISGVSNELLKPNADANVSMFDETIGQKNNFLATIGQSSVIDQESSPYMLQKDI